MAGKKFYITTAIDYVNSLPHIGTAYEKIGADVIARWMRKKGFDVRFQMGNDEHSTNVLKAAKAKGVSTKAYCDEMRGMFEEVWKKLEISYDDFIQTSEERHVKGVQELFQKIYDNGDIKKAHYEGWYCESCEAFYTEKDLVDGACPHHKQKPKWIKEENYFFSLSKYAGRLLEHIEKNPDFIVPEGRRNEVKGIIKGGLNDISVSRAGFEWGIPVPFDKGHVVYVWFDALINYLTAAGYGTDKKDFKRLWPADMHVIGKDIIRFHCVIWPAMLMSAGLPLPGTVFAHGFVYLKGEKMSKSLGNVVTPLDVIDRYGADALRYYLMRTSSFGKDADFTWENFIERYNAELANGLGNLVSRTRAMIEKYFGSDVKKFLKMGSKKKEASDASLEAALSGIEEKVDKALDHASGELEFHTALGSMMECIAATDRYINENKPWELAKKGDEARNAAVLCNVYHSIEKINDLIEPFIPASAAAIAQIMGFGAKKLGEPKTLFPRIEKAAEGGTKGEARRTKDECIQKEPRVETTTNDQRPATNDDLIDISDFAKIDLRIAEIKEASRVEGADKLLKLLVQVGEERRQIVAGIAKHYAPESLIGKKIVVVANLKPAKLRGIESCGMLLAASCDDKLVVVTPDGDIAAGAKVK